MSLPSTSILAAGGSYIGSDEAVVATETLIQHELISEAPNLSSFHRMLGMVELL